MMFSKLDVVVFASGWRKPTHLSLSNSFRSFVNSEDDVKFRVLYLSIPLV